MSVSTAPTEKPEKATTTATEKPEIIEDTPSVVQKRREKEQAELAAKTAKK